MTKNDNPQKNAKTLTKGAKLENAIHRLVGQMRLDANRKADKSASLSGMLSSRKSAGLEGESHASDGPIKRLSMEEATAQMWERKALNAETPEEAEAAEIRAYRQRQLGYRTRYRKQKPEGDD